MYVFVTYLSSHVGHIPYTYLLPVTTLLQAYYLSIRRRELIMWRLINAERHSQLQARQSNIITFAISGKWNSQLKYTSTQQYGFKVQQSLEK